jgi:hypothetical protein
MLARLKMSSLRRRKSSSPAYRQPA